MTRTKKIIAGLCTAALAAVAALGLAGCGEDVAATWAHGKVLEADVTAAAETELGYYKEDDGSYDISSWTNYIANREYIEDATEEEQKAYEKAADGTAADYREYRQAEGPRGRHRLRGRQAQDRGDRRRGRGAAAV